MGMLSDGILPTRESLAFRAVLWFFPFYLRTDNLEGRNGVGSGRRFRREEIYAQKKKKKREGKLNKKSTEFYETELLFMWKF